MNLDTDRVDFAEGRAVSGMMLLNRAVGAYLASGPGDDLAEIFHKTADWDGVIGLAMQNRIANLLAAALGQHRIAPPPVWQARLDRYRAETFRLNARNLMTASAAVSALETAGVAAVVFKGPAQQQRLYGDPFIKPADDVDLLVSGDQYEQAVRVFSRTHYLDPDCSSPWWRIFLGEQPLRTRDGHQATIDLHYRVQQPGCPGPKDVAGFLARRQTIVVGPSQLSVLSPPDACLLTCLNVVKGLVHREASGRYLVDLVAGLSAMSNSEIESLSSIALREGLRATLEVSLQGAFAAYGFQEPRLGPLTRLLPVNDADLAAMIFMPDAVETAWAKRRTILWALCGRRPAVFVKEASWAFAGELCRLSTQPGRSKRRGQEV